MRRLLSSASIAACLFLCRGAAADTPAQCSFSSGFTSSPPSGRVAVTILSMKLNTDMEGEDDLIPGYDDHADVFGTVEIDADGTVEKFDLRKIEESDFPHWGDRFVSRPAPVGRPVHVVIRLRESDPLSDDVVDTSPDPGRDDLEFDLDTCALTVSGDVHGSAAALFTVTSGSGDNQGVLRFTVGMADGRALSSTGDVVLSGLDLVQVLPQVSRLVAQKPTLALVTVANNTAIDQPVSVRLRVTDATNTLLYDAVESLGPKLGPGEVRSRYLATGAPILPTDFSCKDSLLSATATLVLQPGAEPTGNPKVACWLTNNSSGVKTWNVVSARKPSLLWLRTGALLDVGALASMAKLHVIHDLALPFIQGVYPTAGIDDGVSSFPLVPPLSGGVYALLASLLTGLGVPADAVTPFLMVYELSAAAGLAGVDRLMGVLPKAWFRNTLYGLWASKSGLSLGEFMPHAVIFESEGRSDDSTVEGPRLAVPGHELGHTYGLSTDPTIKSWACNHLSGDLGVIACGVTGGFDEYNSPAHPNGVLTWGYWVPQGSSPADGGLTGEQCNSTCLMGPNSMNAEASWGPGVKQWVDAPDYNLLLDHLQACGPEAAGTLYVSGLIAGDDRAELGWTFAQPTQRHALDFAEKPAQTPATYALALLDAKGAVLSVAELPLNWNLPETQWPLQATFFGGHVSLPAGTAKIQLWNRVHKKVLAERAVSQRAPAVSAPALATHWSVSKERFLDVAWSAKDPDGDPLTYFVQVSPDRGLHWWPLAHALTRPSASVSVSGLTPGTYLVRVVASDGVNTASSQAAIAL